MPLVFPSEAAAVFLTSLIPQADERPWIYTDGLRAALTQLDLSFEELLSWLSACISMLDTTVIVRKEALDQRLAS